MEALTIPNKHQWVGLRVGMHLSLISVIALLMLQEVKSILTLI